MQQIKINPIIQWWVTPKLPIEDVFASHNPLSQWIIHPIKRRLSRWYLKVLQEFTSIKVIAITGSSGKTTTTQMLASILKLAGKTVWSREGIDSVYNISNTILRTSWGTKYLILEMSVEYIGEMDFYLWLAKPNVGVITNIFPTHLEFLGDVNGVLKEKSKLVLSLDKSGIAVLNSSDENLKKIESKIKAKIKWFKPVENQNETDAIIATTVADSLNISKKKIFEGIKTYEKPKHRLSFISLSSGAVILDDSYNSNPEALLSTLKLFLEKAGKDNKIAVLGDMKELGKFDEKYHRDIGKAIAKQNFTVVIGVGNSTQYLIDEISKGSSHTKAVFAKTISEANTLLKPYLVKNNYILIKGSRSIGLDKLVDGLV